MIYSVPTGRYAQIAVNKTGPVLTNISLQSSAADVYVSYPQNTLRNVTNANLDILGPGDQIFSIGVQTGVQITVIEFINTP